MIFELPDKIKKIKNAVSVFGSSKVSKKTKEFALALEVGRLLAQNNFIVVNGGYGGVMLASAKGAKEAGGHTIGVTLVKNSFPVKSANEFIVKEIPCSHLLKRLFTLIKLSSAYIIFSGGTGTLLELSAVWEMINKNIISKRPIILMGNNWNPVIEATSREYLNNEQKENSSESKFSISSFNNIPDARLLFSDFIFQADTPESAIAIIKFFQNQ